jgi:hypothetical protein
MTNEKTATVTTAAVCDDIIIILLFFCGDGKTKKARRDRGDGRGIGDRKYTCKNDGGPTTRSKVYGLPRVRLTAVIIEYDMTRCTLWRFI